MVLIAMRLEQGKFAWPAVRDRVMRLSSAQLAAPIRRPWPTSMPRGRGAEHAAAHLDGFSGVLQVDGYAAYRRLDGPTLAYCWSHCRRKFYDIAETGDAPIAEEGLRRIGRLYAVEADIRGGRSARNRSSTISDLGLKLSSAASPADHASPRRSATR